MRTLILYLALTVQMAFGAVYYADFDTGSDSNSGTSTGAPFKHCPGDAEATGTAASTTLTAGDTVNFKGGVVYRGMIAGQASGSAGNFITYQGDSAVHGWGTGKAIMDGSVSVSMTWTACSDAADCWTNANWASMYHSPIPAAMTNTAFQSLLVNGESILPLSQDPNPTDRIQIDVIGEWRAPTSMTSALTVDTARFTNGNPAFYNECILGRYLTANAADYVNATGYDPAANRITNASSGTIAASPAYTIFNNPFHIDEAGEYAVRTNENRIYYWPRNSENPSGVSYFASVYRAAFVDVGHSYLVFNGFKIRGYFGAVGGSGERGVAFDTDSVTTTRSNMVVGNCEVSLLRSMDRDWILEVRRSHSTVTNNTVINSYGGGMIVGGANPQVHYNTFSNLTGTAGYINTATNGRISYNNFLDIRGTHAQGVSIYGNDSANWCQDVRFHNNKVLTLGAVLTHQYSTNTAVYNNLLDVQQTSGQINHWSGVYRAWYVNNTMIGNTNHNLLSLSADNWHVVVNNIMDGGGVDKGTMPNSRSDHNLYIGFAAIWGQGTNDFNEGDSYNTNLAEIFLDPTTRDWRLIAGSPALDSGTNAAAIFWDGSGVSDDIAGTVRPVDSVYDRGAYEGTNAPTVIGYSVPAIIAPGGPRPNRGGTF